jgi:hypothetical protein
MSGEVSGSQTRCSWGAGLPFRPRHSVLGRLSRLGGKLTLTDTSIDFRPLAGLGVVRSFLLDDIATIEEFGSRPPRVLITMNDGAEFIAAVMTKRTSPAWSGDTSGRDDAGRSASRIAAIA